MEAHQRGRYRALPFIATPLEQEGGHGHHHGHNQSEVSLDQEQDFKSGGHSREIEVIRDDTPVFREKEEASTIELFYDLFFVANLTSFTNIHAIDDRTSKSSLYPSLHFGTKKKKYIILKKPLKQPSHHTLAFLPSCGSPGCRSSSTTSDSASTPSSSEYAN